MLEFTWSSKSFFLKKSDDMNHCQGYITESKMKDLHPAMPVTGQSWLGSEDFDGTCDHTQKMCCSSGYIYGWSTYPLTYPPQK